MRMYRKGLWGYGTYIALTMVASVFPLNAQTGQTPPPIADRPIQTISEKRVTAIAWTPDGRFLATSSSDGGGYKIWNASTGQEIRSLGKPYGDWIGDRKLTFTPDGRHLIVKPIGVQTIDGKRLAFALWNIENGKIDRQFFQPSANFFVAKEIALSVAANRLAIAYSGPPPARNRSVIIYDTRSWEIINVKVPLPASGITDAFDISPDGSRIAIGAIVTGLQGRGIVWIYDVDTGNLLHTIENAHVSRVNFLNFDSTGSKLITAASPDGGFIQEEEGGKRIPLRDSEPMRVWSVETGEKLASFSGPIGETRAMNVNMMRPVAIVGDHRSTFWLWDYRSGAVLAKTENASDTFFAAAAFSPDGKRVAVTETRSRMAIIDIGRYGLD